MAIAVTTAIVNCIPGFERGTNLLTMTIMTMAIVIGYKITSTGIEYLIIASRPKLAIAKSNQGKGCRINLVADLWKRSLKNSAVDTIRPTVVVKQVTVTIAARKS